MQYDRVRNVMPVSKIDSPLFVRATHYKRLFTCLAKEITDMGKYTKNLKSVSWMTFYWRIYIERGGQ